MRVILLTLALLTGCATLPMEHLPALTQAAKPYLAGCRDLVLAPAVGCDLGDACALGVGGFVGCRSTGPLVEVWCWVVGEQRCEALRLWEPVEDVK